MEGPLVFTWFTWVEFVGYVASALIVASLLMTSVLRLRLIGLVGAIVFSTYGVLIDSLPVLLTNGTIVLVHLYHLRGILRDRSREAYFEVVPWPITGQYVPRFVRYWASDIARFQPEFGGPRDGHQAFVVLRDMVPVGLVLYEDLGEGTARIELDYVTPAHRDQRAAGYVYAPDGPFAQQGIQRLETTAETEAHRRYLERIGFVPEGEVHVLELAQRTASDA